MTEDDAQKILIEEALKQGFRPISCPLTAADAMHTAEVIEGAPHMLAVTEKDLFDFARGIRDFAKERGRNLAALDYAQAATTLAGALHGLQRRCDDLLAKNVELEQRVRDTGARADLAEAWLQPLERRVLQLLGPTCVVGAQVELLVECTGDGENQELTAAAGSHGEIFSLACFEHAQGLQVGITIPVGADESIEVYFDEDDAEPQFPFKILGVRS